jgi:hypothetical protein
MFIDLGSGEKVVNVLYFLPSVEIERAYVRYIQGSEKIKTVTRAIVPAVYEKCLGIKVEVEGDGK